MTTPTNLVGDLREVECPMCHYRFNKSKDNKINARKEIIEQLIEMLKKENEYEYVD